MTQSEEERTFWRQLGARLRHARKERGLTADEVAEHASFYGLAWTRVTVSGIESGTRRLTVLEAIALPQIYSTTLGTVLRQQERWTMTPRLAPTGDAAATMLDGPASADARAWDQIPMKEIWSESFAAEASEKFNAAARAALASAREAEIRAAATLGISTDELHELSLARFGMGFVFARDERALEAAGKGASARSLQAHRGLATRALLEELMEDTQ